MVEIFTQCWRVLRKDGTLWLNLGDSYCGYKGDNYENRPDEKRKVPQAHHTGSPKTVGGNIKPKDLIGIPWMVAFALRSAGWYLRQDIIWSKPNPMPESVTDRCTKSHEYIFLLSKSAKYYCDMEAIRKPIANSTANDARLYDENYEVGRPDRNFPGQQPSQGAGLLKRKSGNLMRKDRPGAPENNGKNQMGSVPWEGEMANKKSVWQVSTKPYTDAHFATFPQDLIVDMVKAGCPRGGGNTRSVLWRRHYGLGSKEMRQAFYRY